jgi:ABC-type sugar transport system permease subunit
MSHGGRRTLTTTDRPAASATAATGARPTARRRGLGRVGGRGEGRFAVALLLPAALVVFGVVLYPVVRTFVISLFDVTSPLPGDYPFVGLGNYVKVFSDPAFYGVLGHTMYFTLVSTAAELALGIAVALLLNAPLRARWFWRSLVVLPWALPTIVNGALWRWIYNGQYGALNGLLQTLHLSSTPHQWLGTPFLALNMVIAADVWKNTSIVVFFLLAGLQTIPADLYESARMDGAGAWTTFRRITLPLLAPSIAVVLVLRTIEAFKVFDIVYVMTGGGPASGTQTVAFYTYVQAFSNQLFGYGSALAYLIVLAVFALAMVYLRLLRQGQMAGVE